MAGKREIQYFYTLLVKNIFFPILFRDMMKAAAQEDEDQFIQKFQRWKTRPQILFRDMMKASAEKYKDQFILIYKRRKTRFQILFRDLMTEAV